MSYRLCLSAIGYSPGPSIGPGRGSLALLLVPPTITTGFRGGGGGAEGEGGAKRAPFIPPAFGPPACPPLPECAPGCQPGSPSHPRRAALPEGRAPCVPALPCRQAEPCSCRAAMPAGGIRTGTPASKLVSRCRAAWRSQGWPANRPAWAALPVGGARVASVAQRSAVQTGLFAGRVQAAV